MKKEDSFNQSEGYSENNPGDLHMENEILKLKMQAQFGAYFDNSDSLPPEIENQFLKQVQRLEEGWPNARSVKVYDLLGQPAYKKINTLQEDEIDEALKTIYKQMEDKGIFLDVSGDYPSSVIYRFITEELFEHITEDMQMPGWQKVFIYEEFHPNHKMDIERKARQFIDAWFNKEFGEFYIGFADDIIDAGGGIITRDKMKEKLNACLSCYTSFSNSQYAIDDISFLWSEKEGTGLGHAEGAIRYDAELESGETVHIEGPFKLYLSNECDYWEIFSIAFPGFAWN